MKPSIHQVDPDGDTLLILHYPNAPFAAMGSAVFHPGQLADPLSEQIRQIRLQPRCFEKSHSKPQVRENKKEIHFRLSSKHLTLASEYFRKMMANGWKETTPAKGYSFIITAEEWDQKALLILMNIIHGRTTQIPLTISLEMLAKVSVLVDYYKCHEAVEFFAKAWISNLTEPVPSSYGRNLLLRLCISWIFSEAAIFRKLTKTAVYQSEGHIHSLGLPIPGAVIDALEMRRQNLVSEFISSLHDLKSQLCMNEGNCSFECSSILLGAFIKGMNTACIPPTTSQLDGYSFMALEQAVRNIKEPKYTSIPKSYSLCTKSAHPTVPHRCTLSEKTRPIIDAKHQTIVGLELNAFINQD
ncbi:hypothetical protein GGI35DRAFT_440707 [Trichoderma velutinum]